MTSPTTIRKVDPQTDLEAALLGALLLDSGIAPRLQHLKETDFTREDHRLIWRALWKCLEAGTPIDMIALSLALKEAGDYARAGGVEKLGDLGVQVTSSAFAEIHAEHLVRASRLRDLADFGRGLTAEAKHVQLSDPDAIDEWIQSKASRIYDALGDRGAGQPVRIGDEVRALVEDCENGVVVRRTPTGIAKLDDGPLAGGFAPGTLNILASRASVGKTSLALGAATHAAKHVGPVLFFSLETPLRQIAHRILAAEADIDGNAIRTHSLTPEEMKRAKGARDGFSRGEMRLDGPNRPPPPLYVQCPGGLTIDGMRMRCMSFARQHGDAALIVVDHAGLILSGARTAYERATDVSNGLQRIARELDGPPVLALCQLNRELDKRDEGSWPRMSDLRDSGAFEQDADTLLLAHLERANGKPTGRVGLSIGKNRDGETGGRWWLVMDRTRGRIARRDDGGQRVDAAL